MILQIPIIILSSSRMSALSLLGNGRVNFTSFQFFQRYFIPKLAKKKSRSPIIYFCKVMMEKHLFYLTRYLFSNIISFVISSFKTLSHLIQHLKENREHDIDRPFRGDLKKFSHASIHHIQRF